MNTRKLAIRIVGLLAAFGLLVLSVGVHELVHVIQARNQGLETTEVCIAGLRLTSDRVAFGWVNSAVRGSWMRVEGPALTYGLLFLIGGWILLLWLLNRPGNKEVKQ